MWGLRICRRKKRAQGDSVPHARSTLMERVLRARVWVRNQYGSGFPCDFFKAPSLLRQCSVAIGKDWIIGYWSV